MFLRDVAPYMMLSVFVMLATYFITRPIVDIYILLFAKIAVAALMYITLSYAMKSEELVEVVAFLFKRKK
jgi:hypothetical protein